MIVIRLLISLLIYIFVALPASLLAWPCLAIALLTKWDGTTYFFGNRKYGRATSHYAAPTNGEYWKELVWLGWRNPVYNLTAETLAVKMDGYILAGDPGIGDKLHGGFYEILMNGFWEYYWVKPYMIFDKSRCVRFRAGWKINENPKPTAEWAFSLNPWKEYLGK